MDPNLVCRCPGGVLGEAGEEVPPVRWELLGPEWGAGERGAREEHAMARCRLQLFAKPPEDVNCYPTPFWNDHSIWNLSAAVIVIDPVGVPSVLRCLAADSSLP